MLDRLRCVDTTVLWAMTDVQRRQPPFSFAVDRAMRNARRGLQSLQFERPLEHATFPSHTDLVAMVSVKPSGRNYDAPRLATRPPRRLTACCHFRCHPSDAWFGRRHDFPRGCVRDEGDSSAWIRTRDLTIMSRAL